MAFSSLYSAVCRGKWFISFRDVEANLILVDKLLERGITKEDAEKRSDVEPIPVLLSTGGKEAKSGNGFADAPKDSTAIIPIHGTLLKYGTYWQLRYYRTGGYSSSGCGIFKYFFCFTGYRLWWWQC